MVLPKIVSVSWESNDKIIVGQSNNLIVKVEEEILEKAYLFDKNGLKIVDAQGNQVFTKNVEDNYYSNYSGQEIDNFVQEVLGA